MKKKFTKSTKTIISSWQKVSRSNPYIKQLKKKKIRLILRMPRQKHDYNPREKKVYFNSIDREGEDHSLTNVDPECVVGSEQVPAGRQKAITKLSRERLNCHGIL